MKKLMIAALLGVLNLNVFGVLLREGDPDFNKYAPQLKSKLEADFGADCRIRSIDTQTRMVNFSICGALQTTQIEEFFTEKQLRGSDFRSSGVTNLLSLAITAPTLEQAEREAREARERAQREAREQAEREQAQREQAQREQAQRERAQREAREQAEREQAQREAREQAEREQAQREAREQAARERAQREQAQRERAGPVDPEALKGEVNRIFAGAQKAVDYIQEIQIKVSKVTFENLQSLLMKARENVKSIQKGMSDQDGGQDRYANNYDQGLIVMQKRIAAYEAVMRCMHGKYRQIDPVFAKIGLELSKAEEGRRKLGIAQRETLGALESGDLANAQEGWERVQAAWQEVQQASQDAGVRFKSIEKILTDAEQIGEAAAAELEKYMHIAKNEKFVY